MTKSNPRRYARGGCLSWPDADRPETFDALLPGPAGERQVVDAANLTLRRCQCLQAGPDDTSGFRRCSAIAVHEFPFPFPRPMYGHQWADMCTASGRPTPPSARRRGSEACIRQATTTSQIIHARPRTQASTITIDSVGEKPSEPT